MDLLAWAAWIEHSALGAWMRSSSVAYPLVNVIHVFGLVLLIGSMLLLDLRLMGFVRRLPLPDVSDILTPLAIAGLVALIASGFLLFAADAGPLLDNPLFPVKLLFIALGTINALAFRALWGSRLALWDQHPPLAGRLQALASLLTWVIAGTLGRLLAYV
ncbi:MAG TPA: DUF6644 family protein [Burkholderiaceae bacterium]|nr:DUF6644 family protein [Burkholderiaceae bacterium]